MHAGGRMTRTREATERATQLSITIPERATIP